ncbi:MAG: patatin-like phospholipase family protein, partial [Burkholderiales bacterium]|nr:patatin-like phospholipase family protein [Burkholderiales bacterium]
YKKLNPLSLFFPLPRFSTAQKHQALIALFKRYGANFMRDIQIIGKNNQPILFVFVSYDYDRDRAKFFRSWPSLAGAITSPYLDISLVDAVHASSNAPIQFFDQPAQIAGGQYWDGGLTGYNNPVLAAAAEAIAANWGKDQIAILSIGTGSAMLPLLNTRNNNEPSVLFKEQQISSTKNDIKKIAATILADPPDSHTFLAHLLIGGRLPLAIDECPIIDSGLVRLNPLIQANGNSEDGWTLPDGLDEAQFKRLIHLDMAVVAQQDIDLIVHFCDLWMQDKVHNQSIRSGKDFICEIGFARFSDAIRKWQSYFLTPLKGQHHEHSTQLF